MIPASISVYPDAYSTELSNSLTAFYEHPQESRCWRLSRGGVAKPLISKSEAKTAPEPVPGSSSSSDDANERHREGKEPPLPVATAEVAVAPGSDVGSNSLGFPEPAGLRHGTRPGWLGETQAVTGSPAPLTSRSRLQRRKDLPEGGRGLDLIKACLCLHHSRTQSFLPGRIAATNPAGQEP